MTTIIYFDGGSRGNPGPSAGCAVVEHDGQTYEAQKFLQYATVNEAEYAGCIVGLTKALDIGAQHLKVYGDSKLVINQVNGIWQIKASHLFDLCTEVLSLRQKFKTCTFEWIKRDCNQKADALCNRCMDNNTGVTKIK